MLRAIQFNDKSGRSAVKVHLVWSLVTLSVIAALGHLSQGERQDVFPGTFPLRALAVLGHLSQGGEARYARTVHRTVYRSAPFIS